MPYQLMQIKPGIVKDITQYSAGKNGPYWIDGNLVRFLNGYRTKNRWLAKTRIYICR
jgi:hypothetical protein